MWRGGAGWAAAHKHGCELDEPGVHHGVHRVGKQLNEGHTRGGQVVPLADLRGVLKLGTDWPGGSIRVLT